MLALLRASSLALLRASSLALLRASSLAILLVALSCKYTWLVLYLRTHMHSMDETRARTHIRGMAEPRSRTMTIHTQRIFAWRDRVYVQLYVVPPLINLKIKKTIILSFIIDGVSD